MNRETKHNDIVTTTEKQIENKKENKKALKFFIPVIIIAAVVGFGLGIGIIWMKENGMEEGLAGFFRSIMFYAAPWAVIIAALMAMLGTGLCIRKAKNIYSRAEETAADGEMDEEALEKIELLLTDGLFLQSIMQIIQFMFFGAFMVTLADYLWIGSFAVSAATVILFLVSIFVEIKQQQIIVDTEKLLNPSKNGSVYEMNFHKTWEESCDELEKAQIYKSAYKAYRAGTLTCVILWTIFAMTGLLLQSGSLPVIGVSVVWLVMTIVYMTEARKLEKRR